METTTTVERRENTAATNAAAAGMPLGTQDTANQSLHIERQTVSVTRPGEAASAIVWWIAGALNVILVFDFVFRAASANDVGFVRFIYAIGNALAAPFDPIFGATVSHATYLVRWGDLVAIAVYSIVAWGIVRLIRILSMTEHGNAV